MIFSFINMHFLTLNTLLNLREEKGEQRGSLVEELDIVQLQQGDESKCTLVGQSLTP